MTGEVATCSSKIASIPRDIRECLRLLGVHFRKSKSFWLEHEGELEWLLKDAHQAWRNRIKKVHGDYGGSHEDAAKLNTLFDRIKAIFRSKGVTLGEKVVLTLPARTPSKVRAEKVNVEKLPRVLLTAQEKDYRARLSKRKYYRKKRGIELAADVYIYEWCATRAARLAASVLLLAPLLAFSQRVITVEEGEQVVIVRVSKNAVTNAMVEALSRREALERRPFIVPAWADLNWPNGFVTNILTPPTPLSVQMRMRIGAKMAKAAELQPPSPVPPPILGKQFPYISTCSALTTQSVTTVYEVKFLRAIERTAGGALETNFATLQTNTVSVTQTNTPLRPE